MFYHEISKIYILYINVYIIATTTTSTYIATTTTTRCDSVESACTHLFATTITFTINVETNKWNNFRVKCCETFTERQIISSLSHFWYICTNTYTQKLLMLEGKKIWYRSNQIRTTSFYEQVFYVWYVLELGMFHQFVCVFCPCPCHLWCFYIVESKLGNILALTQNWLYIIHHTCFRWNNTKGIYKLIHKLWLSFVNVYFWSVVNQLNTNRSTHKPWSLNILWKFMKLSLLTYPWCIVLLVRWHELNSYKH